MTDVDKLPRASDAAKSADLVPTDCPKLSDKGEPCTRGLDHNGQCQGADGRLWWPRYASAAKRIRLLYDLNVAKEHKLLAGVVVDVIRPVRLRPGAGYGGWAVRGATGAEVIVTCAEAVVVDE